MFENLFSLMWFSHSTKNIFFLDEHPRNMTCFRSVNLWKMAILQIIPFYKQFYISFYELFYKKLHTCYVNWIVHKLEVGIHITIFFWRGCNSEMAPLCSCHALMAGIWTSKLTKIVNELWLTETFWGIGSFKIFKTEMNSDGLTPWAKSQFQLSTLLLLPLLLFFITHQLLKLTLSFGLILLFQLITIISSFFFYETVFIHLHFTSCIFQFQILTWAKLGETGLKSVVPPALSRYIFSNMLDFPYVSVFQD